MNDIIEDVKKEQEVDFTVAVNNFTKELIKKQKPLGREFEEVLSENLLDLYEED